MILKRVMNLQTVNGFIYSKNRDTPFADEETRLQVPHLDALYQRAQVKYHMDSIKGPFQDFQILINNNYEASNCFLWQGNLWIKDANYNKACDCFQTAKKVAMTNNDRQEADKMIITYCSPKNNYR